MQQWKVAAIDVDKICPKCKKNIVIIRSYVGYKALCPCSPKLWGTGESRAEARDSLINHMNKEK
jgi:hypothetical protein